MHTALTRTVALVAAAAIALSGCAHGDARATPSSGDAEGAYAAFPADARIGVALPISTEMWTSVGDAFQADLASAGFTPDVRYADARDPADYLLVSEQIAQVEDMVADGAKAIFVAAVEGSALEPAVNAAKAAGVTVIAFHHLLTGTPDVDFYVAYDMDILGEVQATALLQGLDARVPGQDSYAIEIFSGDPWDANAGVYYHGVMRILQPKLDDGTLVVLSGQTGYAETSTANWDPTIARDRMIDLLGTYYPGTMPDGVLAPNDDLALSIIDACASVGVGIPVVTGKDSTPGSVESIRKGEQYMTVDTSMLLLVDRSVEIAQDLQRGRQPKVNGVTNPNNGVKVVPSILVSPTVVTKDNAAQVYRDQPDLYALTQS